MVTENETRLYTVPESLPDPENSSTREWMVIHTHPGKELLVAKLLQTRTETFIPCDKRLSQDERMINVLPNCVFVQVNENAPMAWIKTTPGFNYMLPGRVLNSDVQEIKKRTSLR